MRYLFYLAILVFILSAASCSEKQDAGHNKTTMVIPHIDTTDPAGTYRKIKNEALPVVDSVYKGLLVSLNDSNRFELLHEHAVYYRQLAGNRKNALALVARAEGFAYNYFTKYDSSVRFFNEAARLFGELNSPADIADCYYGQAMNYLFLADNAATFSYDLKALNIYEQLKDSDNIYKLKAELGNDYYMQQEYAKAETIIQECIPYNQRHANIIMLAYDESLLSKIYSQWNNSSKSLSYSLAALALRRQMNDTFGIAGSLNNIAVEYMSLKQWDKAIAAFQESLQLARQLKESRNIPIIKQNIANCIWHMGRTQEAGKMVLEIIDTAKQKKEELIVTHAYHLLADFNKQEGNYRSALQYYEQYKAHNDSLFSYEKSRAISELSIKYETGKKEAQIAQLHSEKRIDAVKKMVYLLALLCTAAVAGLVILFLGNRNKKNKLAIGKAKRELEANERELRHFTESIISKNKFIEELEQQLLSARSEAEKTIETEENKEQLSRLYQLKILTEEDWRNFKMLFDKVYPGFINRLRGQYQDLAPAEERQFLLIRLNIDNKEAADMLGISADSVKKNRYRLKKRFSLSEQDNLDEFVHRFS